MKSLYAPIYEAITKHIRSEPVGFHVPGHHYGRALQSIQHFDHSNSMQSILSYFTSIMKLDVTELSSTDDLHQPEASIKEAQQLAASCFGAEETYFLVGGSTSGNIALLLAVCEPGDLVIVQRNVHKSIINGLKLAGARAVFLTPQLDVKTGLATIPTLEDVKEALSCYPEAKAVFLTNPNYYGISVKLERYAAAIHSYGKPLIVDEAHGAHYGLHPDLPQSALSSGADAVVQSTHKTLLSLTMGAMLHIQGDRIERDQLRQALAMIQSSSPSFPILASLDISRAMIDAVGSELFEQSLNTAEAFRVWMREKMTRIQAVDWEYAALERMDYQIDPLRVILFDRYGQMTGIELQNELEQYGCWAEMADQTYVVLVISLQTTMEDIKKLQRAIETLDQKYDIPASKGIGEQIENRQQVTQESNKIGLPVSFAKGIYNGKAIQQIALAGAEGQVAAEMIIPYPPGIPIVYHGEILTAEIIERIKRLAAAKAKFQGAADSTLSRISVYKETAEIL